MISFEEIKPKIKNLAEKYRLSMVIVFGSQVKGKTHSQSDVDLAFVSEKSLGPSDIAKMQIEFAENLKVKNLDMTAINGAPPFLLKQMAQNSIVLYEKEHSLFAKFKIYAFKRFMEAKNLLALRELSLSRFLEKL